MPYSEAPREVPAIRSTSGPEFPERHQRLARLLWITPSARVATPYTCKPGTTWDEPSSDADLRAGLLRHDRAGDDSNSEWHPERWRLHLNSVTVTLKARPTAAAASPATYYQVDGGALLTYSGPFTVSSTGSHVVVFHSKDVAGNLESNETTTFSLEAPTSTSLASSVNPSTYGTSVTFTAAVTPSFGSTATGTISSRMARPRSVRAR